MRKIIYLLLTIALAGCMNGKTDCEKSAAIADSAVWADEGEKRRDYELDREKAKAFTTFDEFRMQGTGRTDAQPCVYVWDKGDSIFVKNSDERDSLRLYVKRGEGLWHSRMDYEMWKKKGYVMLKQEWEKPARSYDRYFYNDTILELKTSFDEERTCRTVFVKTGKQVYMLRGTGIGFNSPTDSIRATVWQICSGKTHCKDLTMFSLSQDGTKFYLQSGQSKKMYEYPKTPIGIWAIQPGIDETCLHEGQDIRNFTQQTPNGLPYGNDDTVYSLADKMPDFPGGYEAMLDFFRKNGIDTGKPSDKKQRVVVEFIVERDGSVTNPEVKRSPSPVLSRKALELVSLMPKWTPAEICGKKVRCKYTLPISFTGDLE